MAKAQILIVEDDVLTTMDIENQLKSLGYGVTAKVAYGEDAIKEVKENTPDLVLMDIVLKGEMDGIEAADEIRSQIDIPIVFLTAYADRKRFERAKLTTPFGFIIKPFQDKDFCVTIEMALYIDKVDAERKQAEEALTKSETFLNATERIAKVGGWEIDGKTQKVFWTKEIYNITEVPDDYDLSSLEKEAIVFFSAEDQLILEKAIRRAFEHNEPYDMEFQITTAKGNKKWVQAICEPIVEDGKVVKLGGTFQDITDRKLAEDALRDSEDRYRALFEFNPVDTVFVNNEAKIMMYNLANKKSAGRLPNIGDVMYKDYAGKHKVNMFEQLMECIKSGEQKKFSELKYRERFLNIRISPFSGGVIITSIDTTDRRLAEDALRREIKERKQAEKALKESEKKFRDLFNNSGDAIFIRKSEGRFLEVNQVACDRYGYSRKEFLQMSPNDLDTPVHSERIPERTKSILQKGRHIFEIVHMTKDKKIIPVEISSCTIDFNGQNAIISIVRDITERKQAEETLCESEKKGTV